MSIKVNLTQKIDASHKFIQKNLEFNDAPDLSI